MRPTPQVLARGLMTLGGREAQLLELRFLEGASSASCARFLGVAQEASNVSVLRAVDAFLTMMGEPAQLAPTPSTPVTEAEAATTLARWLDGGLTGEGVEDPPVPPALEGLRRQSREIRRALLLEREALDNGPGARKREALRRVFLGLLIAVTLWLYFQGGK